MREKTKRIIVRVSLFLVVGTLITANCQAGVYSIDTAHSSVEFAIKHLMVSTTKGKFVDYTGTIDVDPADFSTAKIDVTIQSKSIDTHVADRDNHLRNADFLDAEKFPIITFKSTTVTPVKAKDTCMITGDLTLHGVTKEVSVIVMFSGPVQSPLGAQVIGLSSEFTINRKDYGITQNKQMDNGGWMVGEEVNISVNIEAHEMKE